MTHRQAGKIALLGYAKQNGIKIPAGFNTKDSFGGAARTLTRLVQRKNRIPQTGALTPRTLLVIGRYLPGGLGVRASWAMRIVEGPLETLGNNLGPYVAEIQLLGSQYAAGAWPWCAAATSWAYRCAGWTSWTAFVRGTEEAYVPAWVAAAEQGRYGMRVVPWRRGRVGDPIAYQFDNDPEADHIGLLIARPNLITGSCRTVEGNTGPGIAGSQSDGDGLWRRVRDARPPQVLIRVV